MPEYLSYHKDTTACVQHTEPASKQPKEQQEPRAAAPRALPQENSSSSAQLDEEEPSPAGSCLGTKTLSVQALLFLVQKGEGKKKHKPMPEKKPSELPVSIRSAGPTLPTWNADQAVLSGGNILLKCCVNLAKQGFALYTEGNETDVLQEGLWQGQDFILK